MAGQSYLIAAMVAAQFALWLAVWLRHPAALYLQPVPVVLLVIWSALRLRDRMHNYRRLKARSTARERELRALLDKHAAR